LNILNTGIDVLHPRQSNVFLEEGKADLKKFTTEITNSRLTIGKSLRHEVSKDSSLPNQHSQSKKTALVGLNM
jgi:hypothetical protein